MIRIVKMLTTVCLGALLLTSAGCEDKETQEALKTCKNDLSGEQQKAATQLATINDLKTQLAQAQAKVTELTKEGEGKADEKGKAAEKKGEAKAGKKASKK
jgi:uncharacterized protein YlxW (UPF0749 family)